MSKISTNQSGKGSKRRPLSVNSQTFSNNWDAIFGSKDYDIEELEKLDEKIDKNLDNSPEQE